MMKINLLIVLSITIFVNNLYSQSNSTNKKIAIYFNIEGPYKVNNNVFLNTVSENKKISSEDKYFDAINFLGTEKGNPTNTIKEYYTEFLKSSGFEIVIINEKLNTENFPTFNSKKNKYFDLDLNSLKKKYDVDYCLLVFAKFGLEVENLGDKRTTIAMNNMYIDTNTNEILKKFLISDIKNIKKKNLLNPPDYPNIVESMNRLLDERIFPSVKTKLENYIIGSN